MGWNKSIKNMVQKLVQRKSIPRKWIERLDDNPKFFAPDGHKGWEGYFHFMDPTLLPFSTLTYPSRNVTIPNFDKVVPDLGRTILGQEGSDVNGIIGHLKRFTNAGGIEMEIRAWQSGGAKKDVIEVYFFQNRLFYGTYSGTFQIGETIVGQTSNSKAVIINISNKTLTLDNIDGTFIVGETILGGTSGATATIVTAPISIWRQISQNVNPIPSGPHRFYFDQWYDTKEISTIPNSAPSKNLQRAIWVNGYLNPSNRKGHVYSWTGGIALITEVTSGSISIDPSTTFTSLGFTPDSLGNCHIVVNGLLYQVAAIGSLDTNILQLTSTTGINIGDFAFSQIEVEDGNNGSALPPTSFDFCKNYHGYMYYGNWNNKSLYQSNGFNRDYNYVVSNFQALDNDLILNLSSAYTGLTQSSYKLTINSINPDVSTQTYFPGGGSNLNDCIFNTTFYSVNDGSANTYSVNIVSDYKIATTGAGSGTFSAGETIRGGTSGATANVVSALLSGNWILRIALTSSVTFQVGETITGSSTGATAVIGGAGILAINGFTVMQNGALSTSVQDIPFVSAPVSIVNGLQIQFSNYFGHAIGDTWQLAITKGGHDTFTWQKDGGAISSPVAITGAAQTVSDGISITFQVKTGHAVGDFWVITAYPAISRAFANFYYALPRNVGEGYVYTLPANFWTMDTQEADLYVNDTYGHWYQLTTTITVDTNNIANETLSFVPLKQSSQNKVLYPYLTGHMNNELVYITTNKTLDMISRLIAVDKPQVSYLSDPVKLDFDASAFIDGSIEYFKKRLYITSPREGITHCYDFFRSYWQAPKTFPEVGILSVIGDNLVAHSNIKNQSFTMFTNSKGDGENNASYTIELRTPPTARGSRWKSKYSNMSFVEGYVKGNPDLQFSVYLEPDGLNGVRTHSISPTFYTNPGTAPFGEGSFGSHPFGSDVFQDGVYFKELYKGFSPIMEWYFVALGVLCSAKTHNYSFLTLGLNQMTSPTGNQKFINHDNLPDKG